MNKELPRHFMHIKMFQSCIPLLVKIFISIFFITRICQVEAAFDDDLNCMVCEVLVKEVENAVAAVDPKKVLDLGGRLQADGSMQSVKKQYRRSELHLTEVLEKVCEDKMDDYAQGHWKDTKEKDLIQIIEDGQMNPRLGDFELLQDSNLNRGIKDYCRTIVEEQEDELMAFHAEEHPEVDAGHQFCSHVTSICTGHSHGGEL